MSDFRAAYVIPGPSRCAAVTTVVERPWLLREAPQLPLAYCTRTDECACRYQKVPDRRTSTVDRRTLAAERQLAAFGAWSTDERRRSPGRRASDLSAAR